MMQLRYEAQNIINLETVIKHNYDVIVQKGVKTRFNCSDVKIDLPVKHLLWAGIFFHF